MQTDIFSAIVSCGYLSDGDFSGDTFDTKRDETRLRSLLSRVFDTMKDGNWYTLHELSDATGGSEASVSARIRDLRKDQFGGYDVQRRNLKGGLWQYRLLS